MSENKARELFDQYLKAELFADPQRTEVKRLEEELNRGGWYVTSSPNGLTVKRKEGNFAIPKVDSSYFPSESRIDPYQGGGQTTYRPVWITVGIIAGVLALTALVVYIVKKHRKNVSANIKSVPRTA
jgi:hypothetical protein